MREIFVTHIINKKLIYRICKKNSYNSTFLKMGKGFEQTFLEKIYTNDNKYMKRCSNH